MHQQLFSVVDDHGASTAPVTDNALLHAPEHRRRTLPTPASMTARHGHRTGMIDDYLSDATKPEAP